MFQEGGRGRGLGGGGGGGRDKNCHQQIIEEVSLHRSTIHVHIAYPTTVLSKQKELMAFIKLIK